MSRRRGRFGFGRIGVVVAVSALVASATACGGGGAGDTDERDLQVAEATGAVVDVSDPGEPVTGGSITVGLEAESNGWLPGADTFSNSGVSVAYALYDPLMKIDAEGDVRPYLAESLTPNGELTQWTLKLRPGISFHDGTPLDSAALKRIFDGYLTVPGANTAGSLAGVRMDVVDPLTVRYVLDAPNSAFPYSLVLAAGWPFSPTAADAAGPDASSRPVGTGPFVFDSWTRDDRLVVTRNPDYWRDGLPYLDRIEFRPIPDEETRLASLRAGDLDAIMSLRQSAVVSLRELDGIDNYEQLGNSTGANIFNTTKPPLDDVRVRRALAFAVDQPQIIEVTGGEGVVPPSTQMFGPDDPYYSDVVASRYASYDPDAAADQLADYVDDPDRSDGKEPGEPVTFRYDCPPDPSLNEVAQLYQAFWAAIGVEVELRQVEQATHVDEALSGDYQAKCFRVGLDGDPAGVLASAFGEESPLNFTRFTDPQITADIAALRATGDRAERQRLVEEISTIVNEHVPMTYSGGTLAVVACYDHVKNLDGWTYPDGERGGTVIQGTVMWGNVWTTA